MACTLHISRLWGWPAADWFTNVQAADADSLEEGAVNQATSQLARFLSSNAYLLTYLVLCRLRSDLESLGTIRPAIFPPFLPAHVG